ncbi:DUF2304 domain-containing protein [Pedococcus sp.]|uniref:DUF2304 domain-containing protein n=1 Tax=Pedococcus sp. TaxID=2860345 RepID=UPI002E116822|nr:DUF2304 domain-containing protein [Pedococcus sp.]
MKALSIQLVLVLVTLGILYRVVSGSGARTQAVRRLSLLVFGAFAVWSILSPSVWTSLAHLVGIGRGTDLILYGLVIAFFSFVVTSFRRFREAEIRYTKLARRIAIDEAPPAADPLPSPTRAAGQGESAEPGQADRRPELDADV